MVRHVHASHRPHRNGTPFSTRPEPAPHRLEHVRPTPAEPRRRQFGTLLNILIQGSMKDCNAILSLSPILPGSRAPSMSHSFLEVRLNSETAKWEYGVDRAMWSLESLSTSELGPARPDCSSQ